MAIFSPDARIASSAGSVTALRTGASFVEVPPK
jgi:hypothetical protein